MTDAERQIEAFINNEHLDLLLLERLLKEMGQSNNKSLYNCILTARDEVKINNIDISTSMAFVKSALNSKSIQKTNSKGYPWRGLIYLLLLIIAIVIITILYCIHKSEYLVVWGFIFLIVSVIFHLLYESKISAKDALKFLGFIKSLIPNWLKKSS